MNWFHSDNVAEDKIYETTISIKSSSKYAAAKLGFKQHTLVHIAIVIRFYFLITIYRQKWKKNTLFCRTLGAVVWCKIYFFFVIVVSGFHFVHCVLLRWFVSY